MNGIGGGLIAYVKTGLLIQPVDTVSSFNQYCKFKIVARDDRNSLMETLVYMSPNSPDSNNDELNKIISSAEKNCFIVGDFNFPNIDWQQGIADYKSKNFLQTVEEKFLVQAVNFPTHVRGNILDKALVESVTNILDVESLGNLSNSDHAVIMFTILFEPTFNKSAELVPDWKKADTIGLENYLKSVNWRTLLEEQDTEEAWSTFKSKVNLGIENFVPKSTRRHKNSPPWMTKFIKKICAKKSSIGKCTLTIPVR